MAPRAPAPIDTDVLIIGGGSAGCVLAARLSEDPALRVLLIEAGRDISPENPPADIADIYPRAYANPVYFWPKLTATAARTRSAEPYTQARVLGGGSTVMGMWALRGVPDDYDRWARQGAAGWGWSDVEPYFRKVERDLAGQDGHGSDGPVPIAVHRPAAWPPFTTALAGSAARCGWPLRSNLNLDPADGVYPLPISADTRRSSTAFDYLSRAVRDRPNLTILTDVTVDRLCFDGTRVTGARIGDALDGPRQVRAQHVILCCGAIHSPALLMRSGIGRADDLARYDSAPVAINPAVGDNLQNHVAVHLGAFLRRDARQAPDLRAYVMAVSRMTSADSAEAGDLLLSFISRATAHAAGASLGLIGVQLYGVQSRGRVSASPDGRDGMPAIDFNLLGDPVDRARLIWGARQAAAMLQDADVLRLSHDAFLAPRKLPIRLLNEPGARSRLAARSLDLLAAMPRPLRRAGLRIGAPGTTFLDAMSPSAFDARILDVATPMFHVAGTCAIGSVVDAGLQVIGTRNLWVADASVMPVVPRANTNLPTLMIAERAVDLVRAAIAGRARS